MFVTVGKGVPEDITMDVSVLVVQSEVMSYTETSRIPSSYIPVDFLGKIWPGNVSSGPKLSTSTTL